MPEAVDESASEQEFALGGETVLLGREELDRLLQRLTLFDLPATAGIAGKSRPFGLPVGRPDSFRRKPSLRHSDSRSPRSRTQQRRCLLPSAPSGTLRAAVVTRQGR